MISFFYFDLGNVLLHFDHQLACRQMGDVAGVTAERVWDIVFESGLEWRYELGEISDQEFYELFCQATGTRPDWNRLLDAASRIFEINRSIVPVVESLRRGGHRLGVLSNTCSAHWDYCTGGRYPFICEAFDVHALSYRIGSCKPDAQIFEAAARLAGVPTEEIFFVDDVEKNVLGARQAGFDAVRYTTTPELITGLRQRGIDLID